MNDPLTRLRAQATVAVMATAASELREDRDAFDYLVSDIVSQHLVTSVTNAAVGVVSVHLDALEASVSPPEVVLEVWADILTGFRDYAQPRWGGVVVRVGLACLQAGTLPRSAGAQVRHEVLANRAVPEVIPTVQGAVGATAWTLLSVNGRLGRDPEAEARRLILRFAHLL